MFIIPVGSRVDWKRPPVVTLALILINCFVFFFLQSGDAAQERKAATYYFSSDLPKIEFEHYLEYLQSEQRQDDAEEFQQILDAKDSIALTLMEHDSGFMHELYALRIIKSEASDFSMWRSQRSKFDQMRSFTEKHIYKTDDYDPLKALYSTFMHGSLDHIIGNMVVLFLVGFLVELIVGRALFLIAYLISGYGAIFAYTLTAEPGQAIVGASGAIAGVMGLYTVVFGLRRIDFFYSLGFYFDYVKAPAIALLPIWLGNELFQYGVDEDSHVAYMAHFGGLVCGAIIGFFFKLLLPQRLEGRHAEADAKKLEAAEFQKGMDYLGSMEFKKALGVFKGLHDKHPEDIKLKQMMYRAAKADPTSEDYHRAALTLLAVKTSDAAMLQQTYVTLKEYTSLAKPRPRLNPELVARLAKEFAQGDLVAAAEKLLGHLMKIAPDSKDVPEVILMVARGYYKIQQKERFEQLLMGLIRQFPHSQEAALAQSLLQSA